VGVSRTIKGSRKEVVFMETFEAIRTALAVRRFKVLSDN
jgi:hypothetical protein